MDTGLHSVHIGKKIACSTCHWKAIGTFELNANPNYEFHPFPITRPDYSVNGSFEVNGYRYAEDGCSLWAVNATSGEYYCAEQGILTNTGVLSCTTVACHGSTQGGGYGRYEEYDVEARFSVRQIKRVAEANTTTVEFDASRAVCATLDASHEYVDANCTYSWSFPGSSAAAGDRTDPVEVITYTDGSYNATLTMTMEGTGAGGTRVIGFTTPINTYTRTRYDAASRW